MILRGGLLEKLNEKTKSVVNRRAQKGRSRGKKLKRHYKE